MGYYILLGEGQNPHANLAYEEKLMERIGPGDVALYLWQNRNTVVIGRNQNAWKECKCELLEQEGGTLARRSSGGGAVFHDLGNLNFTFAASPEVYDLPRQLGVIADALRPFGIEATYSGRNDIVTSDGRKFSGNAFKHIKNCSMQHGTLLVSVDMSALGKYLNPPQAKMRAKGVDSVRARVCNLTEFNPSLTIPALREALQESFQREYGPAEKLYESDFDIAELYERNSSWDWNYGLTPKFDIHIETRFPWGGIELYIQAEKGIVQEVKAYSDAMDSEISAKLERALIGQTYGAALADALPEGQDMDDIREWLKEELA